MWLSSTTCSPAAAANLAHLRNEPRFEFVEKDICEPFDVGKVDYVFHFASPASPVDYSIHGIETLQGRFARNISRPRSRAQIRREISGLIDLGVLRRSARASAKGNVLGTRKSHRPALGLRRSQALHRSRDHGVPPLSQRRHAHRAHLQHLRPAHADLNDGRVVPNFMKQALRGEDLTVYGDGNQTRSFCYVSDEIDGFLRLSKSDEHLPVNIGNPNEFTILECAQVVLKVTGSKSQDPLRTACRRMIPSSAVPTSPKHASCSDGNRRLISKPACASRSTILRRQSAKKRPRNGAGASPRGNIETPETSWNAISRAVDAPRIKSKLQNRPGYCPILDCSPTGF